MRRKSLFIIVLLFLILFVNLGYANSGPTYWEGYPTFEILSVEKNSPIIVESEELIFDFSKKEYLDHGGNSIAGLVTATYTMSNQSNDDEIVQMAFPFISGLRYFDPKDVSISVDNQAIPFDIYIGEKPNDANLDFNSILKSISREAYTPHNYDLNEIGTLYTYDIRTTREDENFEITFEYDREKTKIISKGFNAYGWDHNVGSFGNRLRGNETVELFVMGQGINPIIGEGNFSYTAREERLTIDDYLNRTIENFEYTPKYNEILSDIQLFNLFSMELDEIYGRGVDILTLEDFYYLDHSERIIIFIYDTHFPKQSSRDVSISYLSRGKMDRTSTVDPLYTFEYLLNPAENWAEFKNLNIEIKPPTEYPYIVESSIDLIRNDDGNYVGYFECLPNTDLSFTLYSNEEVTFIDRVKKEVNNAIIYIPFVVSIIFIPIIVFILRKLKKK